MARIQSLSPDAQRAQRNVDRLVESLQGTGMVASATSGWYRVPGQSHLDIYSATVKFRGGGILSVKASEKPVTDFFIEDARGGVHKAYVDTAWDYAASREVPRTTAWYLGHVRDSLANISTGRGDFRDPAISGEARGILPAVSRALEILGEAERRFPLASARRSRTMP